MQCKIVLANSFTKRQNETEPFTQRVYFLYTLYFSKSIKGTECNLSQSVREKEKQEYFCLALSYFLLVKIQPIRSSIPIFLVYRILSLEDHPISNGMQTSLYMELERWYNMVYFPKKNKTGGSQENLRMHIKCIL